MFHNLQWHICKDTKETAEAYDSLQRLGIKDVDFFQTFSARDATCIQQHDIQYAYVIKVKIWHETLMNRGIEGAVQKRSWFAEGNVELF